jgi:signal transduction histidine kinase
VTDFKVGDIAEVRDNGPILKAGQRFTVNEVLGQRIRIDRPGPSNVFSALIFRKVGGDLVQEPAAAATSLEALISQGLESPVKSVQRAAERARDAVQRFVEVEREERGKAALHAEAAELERKLREVKAKLRGKPAGAAPASKATPKAEPSNQRGNQAVIRAWCQEQGIEVPAKGRLPREAVEAYERAHA